MSEPELPAKRSAQNLAASQGGAGSTDVTGAQPTPAQGRPTRRRFIKGVAATAIGVAGAGYVKPALQSFGVPSANAVSPPPDED